MEAIVADGRISPAVDQHRIPLDETGSAWNGWEKNLNSRRPPRRGSRAIPSYDRRVTVPLWRNRDFVLLEAGRLLSSAGNQISFIAYPLLALAETGSPAKAGLVSFARLLPSLLFSLLAGVAADRYDRRKL